MFNFSVYRKFVTTNAGRRVLIRPLVKEDQAALQALFASASAEDTRFLKDDVHDPEVVARWTESINHERVLPIVACCDDRIVGDVTLHLGRKSRRHVGIVRIFLAPDFRGVGLGSRLIQEVEEIAQKLDLKIVVAEVILDHVGLVKAFRRLGYDLRCSLDDYFMSTDGTTHDVAFLVKRLTRQEFTF